MEYSIVAEGSAKRVVLKGRFTFSDNEHFRQIINSLNETGGSRFVLDMSGLDFMDSAGLGMLLLAHEMADGKRIPLVLKGPKGEVKRMLDVSKFNEIIPIE
ncbi:MAG: hypothetical protein A2516_07055 [Alphaproteobacteria bacterium RIFOXYD12_FULL_60_8]|nr:MAG: hypothetical protein A2516_07055 [Alphaproteobacteria bacterium RIFOXYD12_FULL_60_8]